MATLPIYLYDSAILRAKTLDVKSPDEETLRLVLDMFETMKVARGIGLAANQVGEGKSIFVIDLSDSEGYEGSKPLVFINPTITDYYGDDIPIDEGCLSIPEIREEIIRPEKVHIKYRDINFEEQSLETDGFLARVIQHEYDHLQGIFFTDLIKGLKKRILLPSLRRIKFGEVEADYDVVAGVSTAKV